MNKSKIIRFIAKQSWLLSLSAKRFYILSWIIFVSLFFSSCSLQTTKGLLEKRLTKHELLINPYFSNADIDYIYKAKININDNKFGGILIIKKIVNKHHRVVFTTEFGNKIFDFEFKDGNVKVNFILDQINKKIKVNDLKKDFQLMINESNPIEKMYLKNKDKIYKTSLNNKQNYYFTANDKLYKIVMASKTKEKLYINYSNISDEIAKSITLKHKNFNMNINLIYINN